MTKESSIYIDLIFTTSSNLISNTAVELSLFQKCDHSLIYGVIDFKVPLPPPTRERFGIIKMLIQAIYKSCNVN